MDNFPSTRVTQNMSGFIHYGDMVTLFNSESQGHLNADGVIDNSLRVLKQDHGDDVNDQIPKKFRDCIFKIMPAQQYGARKEFLEKVAALEIDDGEEPEAESYYDSLHESMQKESEMNGARNIEQCGTQTVLRYGHTIQLLHLKTNKYAMADVKRVATQEKDCQYVGVEEDGSMTSWFTILPRYKMRGVGDEVEDSDEVIFELIKQDGSFLHCSKNVAVHLKPFATEGTQLYEASVGSSTGWKMTTYRSSSTMGGAAQHAASSNRQKTRGTLEAGMLVRMFHTEARSYVGINTDRPKEMVTSSSNSSSTNSNSSDIPLRMFAKPEDADIATWRPPASSVWIVETEDRRTGPACLYVNISSFFFFFTTMYD